MSVKWTRESKDPESWSVDVEGVGQYVISRRGSALSRWRAYLNGLPTVYSGSTLDVVKSRVERVMRDLDVVRAASAKTTTKRKRRAAK